jgi:hypothetical protein
MRVGALYDDQNRYWNIIFRLGTDIAIGQFPFSKATRTWHFPIRTRTELGYFYAILLYAGLVCSHAWLPTIFESWVCPPIYS